MSEAADTVWIHLDCPFCPGRVTVSETATGVAHTEPSCYELNAMVLDDYREACLDTLK